MKCNINEFGIGLLRLPPTWQMAAHYHPCHEVIVILEGRMKVLINGQTVLGVPGDVLFYHKGVAHEEYSDSQSPLETFCMSFETKHNLSALPVKLADNGGRIRQLASWLHEERYAQTPDIHQVHQAFLGSLIAEMCRLAAPIKHTIVTDTRTFIRKNINKDITLDDLAREARQSKFAFLRKYKQLAGVTPMDDLRDIRIQYARDLILTSNMPLKEVAPRSGLGDEYHLAKVFRKYLHTSPGELRKKVRE